MEPTASPNANESIGGQILEGQPTNETFVGKFVPRDSILLATTWVRGGRRSEYSLPQMDQPLELL